MRFVTGNPGKAEELAAALGTDVEQDPRGYPEVQAGRLEDVTEAGARHLLDGGLEPPFCLEDAGLFVAALRGFPGVYSRHALDTIGVPGLLRLMRELEAEHRGAAFRADLCYVDADRRIHHFAGTVAGRITDRPRGEGGFGFDPVFVPDGHRRTFAEMDAAEKTALSHRGRAVEALAAHLADGPPA